MASKTVIRPIRPRFRRRPNLQSGNPCQLSVLVFTRKNLHDMKWYFKVHERHVNTISVMSSQLFSTNSAWRTHFVLEIWKTKCEQKLCFFVLHTSRGCHACVTRGVCHMARMQMRQQMSAHSFRVASEEDTATNLWHCQRFSTFRPLVRVKRTLLC